MSNRLSDGLVDDAYKAGEVERERLTKEAKRAVALAFVDVGDAIGAPDAVRVLSQAISLRLRERGIPLTIPELGEILESMARGITVFVAAVKPMQEMSVGYNEPEVDLTAGIFRYCGVQPGDTWVERVERLNAIIDGMREERGEIL